MTKQLENVWQYHLSLSGFLSGFSFVVLTSASAKNVDPAIDDLFSNVLVLSFVVSFTSACITLILLGQVTGVNTAEKGRHTSFAKAFLDHNYCVILDLPLIANMLSVLLILTTGILYTYLNLTATSFYIALVACGVSLGLLVIILVWTDQTVRAWTNDTTNVVVEE